MVSYRDVSAFTSISGGEEFESAGVPKGQVLLKAGLQAIEQGAQSQYDTSFLNLDIDQQKQYLQHISESTAKPNEIWNEIP
ncbi:hypothetical protein DVH26_22170 [Paenibacillus sp. H1-7]|nr:hypothetical protein DVH26_22170 [Paenibacillus sp. H1-7]